MLKLTSADLKRAKPDALVIPVCEDEDIHDHGALRQLIARAREIAGFSGKTDDEVVFYAPGEVAAGRCLLLGLGPAGDVTAEKLRALAGKGVGKCIQMGLSRVLFAVPMAGGFELPLEADALLEAMLEGACLGNHRFDRYKNEPGKAPPVPGGLSRAPGHRQAAGRDCRPGGNHLQGDRAGPRLGQHPGQRQTAGAFRPRPGRRCGRGSRSSTRVLEEKELVRKKFGAILAVGQGSPSRPRLIVLEHRPRGAEKTVVLVGKGVTFDTGGINLKTERLHRRHENRHGRRRGRGRDPDHRRPPEA